MKYLEKIGFSKDDIAYMMENTPEKFIELLKEQKGKHFDPELIDLFFENIDKFIEIRDRYKD